MEGPFHPHEPPRFGGGRAQAWAQDYNSCRVDELASALKASAAIAEPRFSWITAEQVVATLRGGKGPGMVIVDVRDEREKDGGYIPSAARVPLAEFEQRLGEVIALWKAGRHIVLHCTRSLSRAPAATQQLLRRMELEGCGSALQGRVPKVSLLQGGFCAYLEHVMLASQALGPVEGEGMLNALVSEFDPSCWVLLEGEQGTHPKLTHITECSVNEEAVQDKQAAANMDEEVSDELAFLVDQSISLTPQRHESMPYIA